MTEHTAENDAPRPGVVRTADEDRAAESNAASRGHTQAPSNPNDGDRLVCAHCGYSAEFVVLDDGRPGGWVATTPSGAPSGNPYLGDFKWKWLDCCGQQSVDGHLSTCGGAV